MNEELEAKKPEPKKPKKGPPVKYELPRDPVTGKKPEPPKED
jgi:hypothetical protein